MTVLHFCACDTVVERDGRVENVCYINLIDDVGEMEDCGPVSEWYCHDWGACFCLNLYIALGLNEAFCKAYVKGYVDGWEGCCDKSY